MKEIKICSRCIMDSTVPFIEFDGNGECNYCKTHDEIGKQHPIGKKGKEELNKLVNKIKKDGRNKKYDCIVGVSGGTDSTYTLYLTKKLGLRSLAVHYDNGWDSEFAVSNIEKSLKNLKIDLITHVEDWEDFKDIQKAFLRASTPDVDFPTDGRIKYMLYKIAAKHGIKYIVDGHSFRTEGKIPILWSYGDARYTRFIQKRFGTKKLKEFRIMDLPDLFYFGFIKKITLIHILNYINYSKEKAKKIIHKELGWKDYGGHHYESIYTRFCYSYYLPKKFNIDKRRTHFSARIRSGQMSREEALRKINEPPIQEKQAKEDIEYIIKKLEFTDKEFKKILTSKPKTFLDYPNYYRLIQFFNKPLKIIYKNLSASTPYTLILMDNIKNEINEI